MVHNMAREDLNPNMTQAFMAGINLALNTFAANFTPMKIAEALLALRDSQNQPASIEYQVGNQITSEVEPEEEKTNQEEAIQDLVMSDQDDKTEYILPEEEKTDQEETIPDLVMSDREDKTEYAEEKKVERRKRYKEGKKIRFSQKRKFEGDGESSVEKKKQKKERKPRKEFSDEEKNFLDNWRNDNGRYPELKERRDLAVKFGRTDEQIFQYFYNRGARKNRNKK